MSKEERIKGILERAQGGERSALDELTREYRDELVAFADSRLGPLLRRELGAEDVAQEALLKALGAIQRFEWRGERSFRQWLYAIIEHLVRNAARKRSSSLKILPLDIPDCGDSPSHAARKRERFARLERALAELTTEHREVIRLARIEGLKVVEIAHRMERSPGAVHQLLARALEQLKRRFGDTASLSLPDKALNFGNEPDA